MKIPKPVQQPSGKWFIRLRLDGVAYSKTFDTAREAEIWAAGVKSQYLSGQLRESRSAEKKTLRQLMTEYKNASNFADATVKRYDYTMKHHYAQIMDKPYCEIKNWQKIVNMEMRDRSPNTVDVEWSSIAAALRYHGLEVPKVVIRTKPSKQKPYLTADQIPVFCDAIRGHRSEAYFLMMLSSMRVSEALAVTDADISEKGIHVPGTKTAKSDRMIPWIIPRLREIIMDRPSVSKATLNRDLSAICEEKGLPPLSTHSLRISFTSLCYSKGVPERICMILGGWSNLRVMHEVYVRISDDDIAKYTDILADTFH